jgi:hypothetical protein
MSELSLISASDRVIRAHLPDHTVWLALLPQSFLKP